MAITFEIDGTVLIITVDGRWARMNGESTQDQAAEMVKTAGIRGLLVDLRHADIEVTTTDIFEVTISHLEKFPRSLRHALVFEPNPQTLSDSAFFENVAQNRGILARVFSDYDQAKAWLQG